MHGGATNQVLSLASHRGSLLQHLTRTLVFTAEELSVARATQQSVVPPVIATHDGGFHCDEALAVALLKLAPDFASAIVVRTRDPKVYATADVVVDVGGAYDAASCRYDHHQRGFSETLSELGKQTKLSSAGLTWRHHGRAVLAALGVCGSPSDDDSEDDEAVSDALYARVYEAFVEHVDGNDNGVSPWSDSGGAARYAVTTTLAARVGRLNARWNDDATARGDATDANKRFVKAVALCGEEFLDAVEDARFSWLAARRVVRAALDDATISSPFDDRVIILDQYCPWASHLFALEEEALKNGGEPRRKVLYVVFPDRGAGSWRVQAVPVAEGSFTSRLPLPEPWRGLRDADLAAKTGLAPAIFVHASGFIGGCATRDDAVQLALDAIHFDALAATTKPAFSDAEKADDAAAAAADDDPAKRPKVVGGAS